MDTFKTIILLMLGYLVGAAITFQVASAITIEPQMRQQTSIMLYEEKTLAHIDSTLVRIEKNTAITKQQSDSAINVIKQFLNEQ